MSKTVRTLIGTLLVIALAAPAVAQTQTVTGQLIDLACYWQSKERTGNSHGAGRLNCAQACALEGFQVGLLTSDGKLYEVTGGLTAHKNAKLVPHMSHTVAITGDVSEQDGNLKISANDLKMIRQQQDHQ